MQAAGAAGTKGAMFEDQQRPGQSEQGGRERRSENKEGCIWGHRRAWSLSGSETGTQMGLSRAVA